MPAPASKRTTQLIQPFVYPSKVQGCVCDICARKHQPKDYEEPESVFDTYSLQQTISNQTTPVTSPQDFADFEKKQPKICEWMSYSRGDVRDMSWFKTCAALLRKLQKLKGSRAFSLPVDYIALNLPSYRTLIQHPMDLGTIDRRLNSEPCEYTDPDDFVSDVRMIFWNAWLFNGPQHSVTKLAETFSLAFEEELATYGAAYMIN